MAFKTYITLMIKLSNKNKCIYFENKLRLISFLSLPPKYNNQQLYVY